MTGEVVSFPPSGRVVQVTGFASLWLTHVEPRGGFEELSMHFARLDDALVHAERIGAEHGWPIKLNTVRTPPPITAA